MAEIHPSAIVHEGTVLGENVRVLENAVVGKQPSLGVHDLSVILYLLDEAPELATAQGSASIHPGVEDVVFCFLRFPSGKIAHMHLSWLDPHKMRKMTVVGREKMAVFDDMEPERKVTVYEKKVGQDGVAVSGDIHVP
jgi:predicted dehydrogenase